MLANLHGQRSAAPRIFTSRRSVSSRSVDRMSPISTTFFCRANSLAASRMASGVTYTTPLSENAAHLFPLSGRLIRGATIAKTSGPAHQLSNGFSCISCVLRDHFLHACLPIGLPKNHAQPILPDPMMALDGIQHLTEPWDGRAGKALLELNRADNRMIPIAWRPSHESAGILPRSCPSVATNYLRDHKIPIPVGLLEQRQR